MWWCVAALGQTVDDAAVDQLVAELYPLVGERLGRSPAGPLRSGILPRERLIAAFNRQLPMIGERRLQGVESAWVAQHTREIVEDGMAVFVPALDGVYVVQEAMDELFAEGALAPDQLLPALRCILAHELVHAYQHQYESSPFTDDEDLLRGLVALQEGHATHESLELCATWEGPAFAARVAAIQGMETEGTVDAEDPSAPYTYGRALAGMLRREDPELVWAALASPPPRWSDVVSDIKPMLGAGWEDPAVIRPGLEVLEVPGAISPDPYGPRYLSWLFGSPTGFGLPVASAGWVVETGTTLVAAFRMTEPGTAADLLSLRATEARAWHDGLPLAVGVPGDLPRVSHGRVPALDERADLRMSLRIDFKSTQGARYRERWAATDRVLVVVATRDRIARAAAEQAVAVLLDRLPTATAPGSAPLAALGPWLETTRAARPATVASPSPAWRLQAAGTAWELGTKAPCGPAFEGTFGLPDPWRRAAYLCAVASGEWATAERAAEALPDLEAYSAAHHAQALLELGRVDDALDVLARAAPQDDVERWAIADTRLFVLGTARRWTELATRARLPEGTPEMRAQAADALWSMGRTGDARAILGDACPNAPEPTPAACMTRPWR